MLDIKPIKALADNYIWSIKSASYANQTYFVDFGDIKAAEFALEEKKLDLQGILITHHHWDHTDGIAEFVQNYQNSVAKAPLVFGNKADAHRLPPLSVNLEDKSEFVIFDRKVTVFEIPGHTLGHLAYLIDDETPRLFCGDTLFSAGCGRTFEGSAEQMHSSLMRLASLDKNTLVYPAHEYTLSNLKFAEFVEPNNKKIKPFAEQAKKLLKASKATIPTRLKTELEINPFLRTHSQEIKTRLEEILSIKIAEDPVEIFAHLRKLKDDFKA